jgi:hypothetical protein
LAGLEAAAAGWADRPVHIGVIRAAEGIELRRDGRSVAAPGGGWDHFAGNSP